MKTVAAVLCSVFFLNPLSANDWGFGPEGGDLIYIAALSSTCVGGVCETGIGSARGTVVVQETVVSEPYTMAQCVGCNAVAHRRVRAVATDCCSGKRMTTVSRNGHSYTGYGVLGVRSRPWFWRFGR